MMLIRTDSSGYSGCHEQDAHPLIDTTNFVTQTLAFTETQGITANIVVSNSLAWNLIAEDACLYIEVSDSNEEEIEVYPNPASEKLAISFPIATGRQFAINTIEIYSTIGEMLLAVQPQTSNFKPQTLIDVSYLPSGFYFLKLTSSTSEIIKKIIIQKN
jgi:hypothetical protein